MATKDYEDANVICPFYRKSRVGKVNRIICEGISDKSSISQIWSEKKGIQRHMKQFCCDQFSDCYLHQMLMWEKYNDEHEE